eukprot:PhF_6_TR6774/c0_g1_i1/m.9759
MTTLYSIQKFYQRALPLAQKSDPLAIQEMMDLCVSYASNRHSRQKHVVHLKTNNALTTSTTVCHVWLSTLPWEVQEGLNGYMRASLEQGVSTSSSSPYLGGMLFRHPQTQPVRYWISRVQFDLDVVFFDEHQQCSGVGCITRKPPRDATCGRAMYALELIRGKVSDPSQIQSFSYDVDSDVAKEFILRQQVQDHIMEPFERGLTHLRKNKLLPRNTIAELGNTLGIYLEH